MRKISPSNGARKSGVKRTVRIGAHNVSVSLEDAFWDAFKEIAEIQGIRRAALVSIIKSEHQGGNLSSAIRLFILGYDRGGNGTKA